MSAQTFVLGSAAAVQRLVAMLSRLQCAPGRHWKVTVERINPRHTDAQLGEAE